MVSLTIGLLLLAAFVVLLDRCRRDFATNESLASLQDAARSARFGAAAGPGTRRVLRRNRQPGSAGRTRRNITATAADLRQPGPADARRTSLRPARGRPRLRSQFRRGSGHSRPRGEQLLSRRRGCARLCAGVERGWRQSGHGYTHGASASLATTQPRAGRLQLQSRSPGRACGVHAVRRRPRTRPGRRAHRNSRCRNPHLLRRQPFGRPTRLARPARQVADRIAWRGAVSRRGSVARASRICRSSSVSRGR